MRKLAAGSPWFAALLSWLLATVLIGGVYVLWVVWHGGVVHWTTVRDAAGMAALIALFRAWRDSSRRG